MRRQLDVALLLGLLDAAFDVANRVGVFFDLDLVLRPELLLEARQLLRHRIQNALVLPQPRFARGPIGAAAIAEQLLEHRCADSIPSAAAASGCARRACACRRNSGCPCRRRRWPGSPSRARAMPPASPCAKCRPSNWSIDTSAMISISLRPAARRAGEKRSGGARVDVVPARFDAGQDQHLVPVGGQRLQNRRELESRPFALGRPILHGHAVRHVEGLEAVRGFRRGAQAEEAWRRGTAAPWWCRAPAEPCAAAATW